MEQLVNLRVAAAVTVFALAGLSNRAVEASPVVFRNGIPADVRVASMSKDTPNSGTLTRELLNRAIQEASLKLQRKECAAFFGAGAKERLVSAEYKLLSLGAPRFQSNEPVVTAARTIRETNTVVINTDGPFVKPRLALAGRYYYFNVIPARSDGPVVLSDSEFRVLILLHELGHLMGKYGSDRKNLKLAQTANTDVLNHCF